MDLVLLAHVLIPPYARKSIEQVAASDPCIAFRLFLGDRAWVSNKAGLEIQLGGCGSYLVK
jgi:hypothetical protein